jgi:preprotein translocase subunit SecG
MTVLPLLAVGLLMKFVAVLFVLVSLVLVLVVLMQKGRGGGLSGAFAGGMASGLLGSKTGDFLTWTTIVVVGVFLLLAIFLAKFDRPRVGQYGAPAPAETQQPAEQATAPTQPPAGPSSAPTEPPTAPAQPEATGAAAPAPAPGGDVNAAGS